MRKIASERKSEQLLVCSAKILASKGTDSRRPASISPWSVAFWLLCTTNLNLDNWAAVDLFSKTAARLVLPPCVRLDGWIDVDLQFF